MQNNIGINPNLSVNETINKKELIINDQITFTTIVKNTGNVDLKNVTLTSNLNENLTFILNSIYINNILYEGDLSDSINLNNLEIGKMITVIYMAKCKNASLNVKEQNIIKAKYQSQDTEEEITKNSNLLLIDIYDVNCSVIKSINANILEVNEEVTFYVYLINNGSLEINNLNLTDNLKNYFTFVPNSIMIDNIPYDGCLENGIKINSLPINKMITISFRVICNQITNNATNDLQIEAKYKNKNKNYNNFTKKSNLLQSKIIDKIIPEISLLLTEDKTEIVPNELLTYRIQITNTGNISFTDIMLSDVLNNGLEYVEGSLLVNNVPIYVKDLNSLELEDLEVGTETNVVFKVKTKLSSGNIQNKVNFYGKYGANKKDYNKESNQLNILINQTHGNILFTKEVSTTSCKINDHIHYILKFVNNGNTDFEYVYLKDNLSEHFELIKENTKIDNVKAEDGDVTKEMRFDNVKIGDKHRIDFEVIAREAFPQIANTAILAAYKDDIILDFTTNEVYVDVLDEENLDATINLTMNKKQYYKNEIALTTIKITNTGSSIITKATIKDEINEFSKFINNSIKIDGENVEGNIVDGIDIYNIKPNESKSITFNMELLKTNESCLNLATIKVENKTEEKNIVSNEYTYNILDNFVADLEIEQIANSLYLNQNEETEIKLRIKNTGNIALNNVKIADQLPNGLNFIENSLKYNYISSSDDITKGITISKIEPNYVDIITFKVKATDISQNVLNYATAIYHYKNFDDLEKVAYVFSNHLYFYLNELSEATLIVNKTSDKNLYLINEVATFNIIINNIGNLLARDIIITDQLPSQYEIIPNSIKIDDVETTQNLETGLKINDLKQGGSTTITFKATAKTIGQNILNIANANYKYQTNSGNIISRTALGEKESNIQEPEKKQLVIVKKCKNSITYLGEEIEFEIDAFSNEDFIFNLKDELNPEYYDFVLNSLTIDNQHSPENIKFGININSNSTVKFSAISLKTGNDIPNVAIGKFDDAVVNSNKVYNTILNKTAELSITKTMLNNKTFLNDINNIKLTITNTGAITAKNVTILDNIDEHYQFIKNSLKINDILTSDDITKGVNIGTINPNEKIIVSFNVFASSLGDNLINVAQAVFYSDNNNLNNTIYSNPVLSNIVVKKQANLTISKTQEKAMIKLGETNTYNLNITNEGNAEAKNLFLTDLINDNLEYIPNSLIINQDVSKGDLKTGITIKNLLPNEVVKVSYKLKGLISADHIPNQAKISYDYLDSNDNLISTFQESNFTYTDISNEEKENIVLIKTMNKLVMYVDDINEVNIDISNIGNKKSSIIKVVDLLSNEYQFVPNSLYYNGQIIEGDITQGVIISSIDVLKKATISFKIKAIEIKEGIINTAFASTETDTYYSNDVTTDIIQHEEADLTIIQTTNKQNINLFDTIKFNLEITNNSNTDAKNIVIQNLLPINLQYEKDTLFINEKQIILNDPSLIKISEIKVNQTINITFKAIAVIAENGITNLFKINYNYLNKENNYINKSKDSNVATINIYEAVNTKINIKQSVNTQTINLFDTNEFVFNLTNTGNTKLTNLVITNYLTDHYELDGFEIDNKDLAHKNNIILDELDPQQEKTIKIKAVGVLSDSNIINKAIITYNYKDYLNNNYTKVAESNEVTTNILDTKAATLFINKETVSKTKVETVNNVTLTIANIGNTNATNIFLREILAKEFSLINSSLFINDEQSNENILTGLSFDTIIPQQEITIKYQINANKASQQSINSTSFNYNYLDENDILREKSATVNTYTEILNEDKPIINIIKDSNKFTYKINDIITYRIDVYNLSSIPIYNCNIKDLLSDGLEFVNNSVKVNGILTDENIINGISVSDFDKLITITFKAKAIKTGTIDNIATINYSYKDLNNQTIISEQTSDNLRVIISEDILPAININKMARINIIEKGALNSFIIKIANVGSKDILNIHLRDLLNDKYSYVKGSLKLNDTISQDNLDDIFIDNLLINDIVTISFDAIAIVSQENIPNQAFINYQFFNIDNQIMNLSNESNIIITSIINKTNIVLINILSRIYEQENILADLILTEINKINTIIKTKNKLSILQVNESVEKMITSLIASEEILIDNLKAVLFTI